MLEDRIQAALDAFSEGQPVIVVDDADRENEGDLIIAAEKATPESLAFMIRHTSGLICAPLPGERLDALRIPLMVPRNTEAQRTAFTVSVDARLGTTTGISAADRARTIQVLVDPNTQPEDLARPGHIFPLRARDGGVLVRRGHTEAALDLAELAGVVPGGALAEVMNDDGTMARLSQLERFAAEHHLVLISIADLVAFRAARAQRVASTRLPTEFGAFSAHVFSTPADGAQHVALVHGDVSGDGPVLVRLHSECLTGDVFGSRRCDCGEQLRASLRALADAEHGVLVYVRGHEGRGIGLGPKLQAYSLQDRGLDTVDANLRLGYPADGRVYSGAASILRVLGVRRCRLLTNNPAKCVGLADHGIDVVERVPLVIEPNPDNARYLRSKQDRLGHLLGLA
jgi:3,4-dihydroxy 2-butanone 4-phosphate synthase / GTP cyclohydrolase II